MHVYFPSISLKRIQLSNWDFQCQRLSSLSAYDVLSIESLRHLHTSPKSLYTNDTSVSSGITCICDKIKFIKISNTCRQRRMNSSKRIPLAHLCNCYSNILFHWNVNRAPNERLKVDLNYFVLLPAKRIPPQSHSDQINDLLCSATELTLYNLAHSFSHVKIRLLTGRTNIRIMKIWSVLSFLVPVPFCYEICLSGVYVWICFPDRSILPLCSIFRDDK